MRVKCIVDACSLIYMMDIELAGRSLLRWLWDEFDVSYSECVWGEVEYYLKRTGRPTRDVKADGNKYAYKPAGISACENALFGRPYNRRLQLGRCRHCGVAGEKLDVSFLPDITTTEDRGERHNCCVSLLIALARPTLIVFITDDIKGRRDFARPMFETFPLGTIWTSHDLVLYLFMRHRKRILPQTAEAAIRDLVAHAASTSASEKDPWIERLRLSCARVRYADKTVASLI